MAGNLCRLIGSYFLIVHAVSFGLTIFEFFKLPVKKRNALKPGSVAYFTYLFIGFNKQFAGAVNFIFIQKFKERLFHGFTEIPGEIFFTHV